MRAVETADGSTLWVSARGDNRVLAFSTGMLETNPGNALLGYADTGGTAPVGLRLFDSGKLLAVANSNRFGTGTGRCDCSFSCGSGVGQRGADDSDGTFSARDYGWQR